MEYFARNKLFSEYINVLHWTIHKNRRLLRALHLENNDVFQELAIVMLKAIDGFDNTRSTSLFTHIICKLQYAVLNLRDHYKPHGITGIKRGQNVVFAYTDNDDFTLCSDWVDLAADCVIATDLLRSLSNEEREAVRIRLEGRRLRRKVQKAALLTAQEKIMSYYTLVVA